MPRKRNNVPPVPEYPECTWSPARPHGFEKAWEGTYETKPWDYTVTAVIPHLDTPDLLPLVIETLRLQTERPFIIVIDTGSLPEHWDKVEALACEDVEVHRIRLNGAIHPSDPVAMAMDLAQSLCRTDFLYCTHADVFLRRRDFLADLLALAREHKVAGYEITPRGNLEWEGMVSHTATMIDIKFADAIGLGWSQRRLMHLHDVDYYGPDKMPGGWPDTEVLINIIFRREGFQPLLIGKEQNYERTVDDNIDHVRSLPSATQYSPAHLVKATAWLDDALTGAAERVTLWRNEANHQTNQGRAPGAGQATPALAGGS